MSTPNSTLTTLLSARLESLRGTRTQKEFARIIGIPLRTYTNWIAGQNVPRADQLYKICNESGASSDWLLGLSDIPPKIPVNVRAEQAEKKLVEIKRSLLELAKKTSPV